MLYDVQQSYIKDSDSQSLLSKLAIDSSAVPHFTLQNGILKYKNRIWDGQNPDLQHRIITALHNSPLGGHSGATATYSRLKSIFAWKHMKSFVQNFVKNCQICAQAKLDHSAYLGKLQPLPIPQSAWDTFPMDFVEGLPISGNANCILVVVDKFTKYAHFLPISHPYTALTVA